jgi:hypothetical protein
MEEMNLVGIGENSQKQMWEIEMTQLGPLVVVYDDGKFQGPINYAKLLKLDPHWRDPTEEEIESINPPVELKVFLGKK